MNNQQHNGGTVNIERCIRHREIDTDTDMKIYKDIDVHKICFKELCIMKYQFKWGQELQLKCIDIQREIGKNVLCLSLHDKI